MVTIVHGQWYAAAPVLEGLYCISLSVGKVAMPQVLTTESGSQLLWIFLLHLWARAVRELLALCIATVVRSRSRHETIQLMCSVCKKVKSVEIFWFIHLLERRGWFSSNHLTSSEITSEITITFFTVPLNSLLKKSAIRNPLSKHLQSVSEDWGSLCAKSPI